MRQRLRRAALRLCVTGCVLLTLLWIRGLFRQDVIRWDGVAPAPLFVLSQPHNLQVWSSTAVRPFLAWPYVEFGNEAIPARLEYLELRWERSGNGTWKMCVPHWLPMLVLGELPARELARRVRPRAPRASGLCPGCGYDLRATPDRCPECGLLISGCPGGAATCR